MSKKIFSVPFNTDFETFPEQIIEKYHEHIAEVYFPLPSDMVPNARGSLSRMTVETISKFSKYLVSRDIKPVGLFNSTWTPIEAYADENLSNMLEDLVTMYDAGLKDIIVNNYYFIAGKLLDGRIPGLNIRASINSRFDTPDKVMAHVGFARPKTMYLDRSFNRKWNELVNVTNGLRMLEIESIALANEGCLYNCPFKTDHDSQLGMSSYFGKDFLKYTGSVLTKYEGLNERISGLNESIGCANVYRKNPWYLLKSPFIRPEDLDKYLEHVDIIKLAGRNRSTDWIENMLTAYINRSYEGSILDILDIADNTALDAKLYDNKSLDGILDLTKDCHKVCISCGRCKAFFERKCLNIEPTQITDKDLPSIDTKLQEAVKQQERG